MRGLVIGRFQPFHLGHLKMAESAAKKCDFLTIGIGSSNISGTLENPFSADERKKMIKASFKPEIPYEIKLIPDLNDPPRWAAWIKKNTAFDEFYTNSEKEKKIFQDAGCKVVALPFFLRRTYCASEVRFRIMSGGDWAGLLPSGAVSVMRRVDGVKRIKALIKKKH